MKGSQRHFQVIAAIGVTGDTHNGVNLSGGSTDESGVALPN